MLSTCAAKASCISMHAHVAQPEAGLVEHPRRPGRRAHEQVLEGVDRGVVVAARDPEIGQPSARATSSAAGRAAEAPSVSGEALPAVTVPKSRSNTGFNFASFSSVVSSRGWSSRSTIASSPALWDRYRHHARGELTRLPGRDGAGVAVGGEAVLGVAADAEVLGHLLGELAHRLPVEGSAIAGATGARSCRRTLRNARRRSPTLRALLAVNSASRNLRP